MEKLKYLRNLNNISQKELAEKLNISRESISKYEKNEQEPSFATLKKIAKYFNVTIDYLLDSSDENLVLISKEDLQKLKTASQTIDAIAKKLDSQGKNFDQSNNIQIGDHNSIHDSFNGK